MENIVGPPAHNAIYELLRERGITQINVSSRFDEVVIVLTDAFGECSRVIIHKAIVGLFREYSQRADFSYQDSLRDHLTFLRARVVEDHLVPRSAREPDHFLDKNIKNNANSTGIDAGKDAGWSGFYHLKKGVGREHK